MSFWTPNRSKEGANKFHLTADVPCCVGHTDQQFFMGGVAMAAAIDAAEQATEKPLLWATIHFVSHGMLNDPVDIQVEPRSGGRSVTQVGVTNSVRERPLQHMSAALGGRVGHTEEVFALMPNVLPPEECPLKDDNAFAQEGNLLTQFERRTALEDSSAGIEHMWIRPKFESDITSSLLALVSDFFLGAHKRTRGGTSLDNTIRIHSTENTDWILCVTNLTSISNGAVHGNQFQFAKNGTLLSSSSQTGLLPRTPNR